MGFGKRLLWLLASAATAVRAADTMEYLGVAIAGGEFGCYINGTCDLGLIELPLTILGGADGAGQMKHFVHDDGINMFRLSISWQYLINSTTLDNRNASALSTTNVNRFDQLMQACFNTGAYCMIDLHNFGRFNDKIIGQGGPTNDDFASLWSQLAKKYAKNDKTIFGLMNEPHDLDIDKWAETCQLAVTAIRKAGAAKQMILLPGTNFDSAATIQSSGSADALFNITNPDGTTDGLILDVHKYLDENNSGDYSACTTDNTNVFRDLADFLRQRGRQAFVSETGAPNAESCLTMFCAQNRLIIGNADVFVGLVAWGAGAFKTSYPLSLTPGYENGTWLDTGLFEKCVLQQWPNAKGVNNPTRTAAVPTASATASSTGGAGGKNAAAGMSRPGIFFGGAGAGVVGGLFAGVGIMAFML